jgi:uncharacterized protein YecE (DUF72 family)
VSPGRSGSGRVRIGCSGWNYDHWRGGVFYPSGCPAGRWLAFYAGRFDTVELNTTFYRLPGRAAAAGWVAQTPPGFVFAVKVSRYLTHVKRLRETPQHLALLLERIEPLLASGKLGPLLWQLPPNFKRDDERLAAALEALPATLRHAIEFRHESWFTGDVTALLRERNVALVIADRPEIGALQTRELTADFVFIRFHHGSHGVRGSYGEHELGEWAGRIRGWRERGDVYAYFNNDWEGFAPANAASLAEKLGVRRMHPDQA